MDDVELMRFGSAICGFIESRKLDLKRQPFIDETAVGFNLACELLSHELMTVINNPQLRKVVSEYKEKKDG